MTVTNQGPGYVELELDLISALRRDILEVLPQIAMQPLEATSALGVPDAQGVYFLYLRPKLDGTDLPVYVGKTDAGAGLRRRLSRHAVKIMGRKNIAPSEVYFRAVRLFVFTALDIETDLIGHFGREARLDWNNSGFGSNDPGRERDTTTYKAEHFDTQFPIDIDTPFFDMPAGSMSVAVAMQHLKDHELLPYTVRFQRPNPSSRNSFHPDFLAAQVTFSPGLTVAEIVAQCIHHLPGGWHATALPSHIIVYKNDPRRFPSGTLIAQS